MISMAAVLTGIDINPTPVQPPGTAGILTWFNYATWIAMMLVAGSMMVGVAQVAVSMRHGGEINGVKRFLLSVGALIVLGSFGAVLGAFG